MDKLHFTCKNFTDLLKKSGVLTPTEKVSGLDYNQKSKSSSFTLVVEREIPESELRKLNLMRFFELRMSCVLYHHTYRFLENYLKEKFGDKRYELNFDSLLSISSAELFTSTNYNYRRRCLQELQDYLESIGISPNNPIMKDFRI